MPEEVEPDVTISDNDATLDRIAASYRRGYRAGRKDATKTRKADQPSEPVNPSANQPETVNKKKSVFGKLLQ